MTLRDDADGSRLDACLITQHLEFSVPYRLLFLRREHHALRDPLIDAMAQLLVRLHLNGFFWGDCSLSNTLFRRDAGSLAAYLVDTETGELHDELSTGQRTTDVELAAEKTAGELLDLQAAGVLGDAIDPADFAVDLQERYARLWTELTHDEVFATDERHRIHDRLRRINEIATTCRSSTLVREDGGLTRLHLRTSVLEPGRYQRLLRELTALEAQDLQARVLLNDIRNFGAWLADSEGVSLDETVVARRWLERSFEPTVALVPRELRGRRQAPQVFVEVLEHWQRWSAEQGVDLELFEAAGRYVSEILPSTDEEQLVGTTDA